MPYYDTVSTPSEFIRRAASEGANSFLALCGGPNCRTAASKWDRKYFFACKVVCSPPVSELRVGRTRAAPLATGGDLGETIEEYWPPIPSCSPPGRRDPESSGKESIGYVDGSAASLVEDFTVRFISSLVRCVLNCAQPVDKEGPFVQYRDARLGYRHKAGGQEFEAVDDGGVELVTPTGNFQVALLEAKRGFDAIKYGSPTVPDDLLGQIVGEALAARLDGVGLPNKKEEDTVSLVSEEDVFSIVAVKQYVKIMHLDMSQDFLNQFMASALTDRLATFLNIQSTRWLGLNISTDRKIFVRHLMALIAWADDEMLEESPDSPMED